MDRTKPGQLIDFNELYIFNLLNETRSFTRTAQLAGLTQSAVTKQIQNLEAKLGLSLFERTTRHVSPTPAGDFLSSRAELIVESLKSTQEQFLTHFKELPKTLKVGAAKSIGMAYLPGIFKRYRKVVSDTHLSVNVENSNQIIQLLLERKIDVALVMPPKKLPRELKSVYEFEDPLTIILPPEPKAPKFPNDPDQIKLLEWLSTQTWILISKESNSRELVEQYFEQRGLNINPSMEMDNFDLIFNLVSIGLGISIIPHRVIPLYANNRKIQKIILEDPLARNLNILTRKDRKISEPIQKFIDLIAF